MTPECIVFNIFLISAAEILLSLLILPPAISILTMTMKSHLLQYSVNFISALIICDSICIFLIIFFIALTIRFKRGQQLIARFPDTVFNLIYSRFQPAFSKEASFQLIIGKQCVQSALGISILVLASILAAQLALQPVPNVNVVEFEN